MQPPETSRKAKSCQCVQVVSDALTGTSNQLVPGMLPPVLTGVLLPASMASISSQYFGGVNDVKTHSRFGTTALINLGLYTGGSSMGISTNDLRDAILFGGISAVLLPIPSWLGSNTEHVNMSLWMEPMFHTSGMIRANYRMRF